MRDAPDLFNLQFSVQTLFSISVPRSPRVWVSKMSDCKCQTHIHFRIALARRYMAINLFVNLFKLSAQQSST